MANCAQCGRKISGFSFGKRICVWCVRHEAAQRGETSDDAKQPVMPVPWERGGTSHVAFTHVLVGINAAVFLGMVLAGTSFTDPSTEQLVRWGANWGPLTLGGQSWRLLTCLFLHGGILHIGFNMWCLWDLGALCESLYGPWTFGAVYFISGVAASIASVAWHPGGVSVGASGAIFGLAGALIASYYVGEFTAPRAMVRGTLRSLVVFAAYSLIFGAMSGRTDNAAHVGGLVTGLVFGALIARLAPDTNNIARRFGAVSVVALAVLGGGAWLHQSHSFEIHARRGVALMDEKKDAEAIPELQAAIRQQPGSVPARFALAYAYSNNGQLAQAEAELKRVIELDPRYEPAYFNLGVVYLDQKRTQQAKETFARMMEVNHNSAYAHFGLGRTLANEGDHQGAIREYQLAAGLRPDLDGVSYNMGLSYAGLKMYDEAIAAFLKEQESHGDDYRIEVALSDAYKAKGMTHQAEEAMRKAEQLKSGQ
jgi:membrane associated rhomboid family serine protease/Flp pilus assembly protein TadD